MQDTDKVWTVHGQNVGQILLGEARDAGFGLGEVSQAFLRLESGTQNTTRSLQLLDVAENVARGRHIELAQAAGILARAEQGSDTALRRLGIIIPAVTKHVDALKQQHAGAIAQGVKFTAVQTEQYKVALLQAAALDKQATKTNVVAEVQARFAGQSSTFAHTAAGEFARLHENISQFEAGIGRDLLPTLNSGIEQVGHWVDELRQSEEVHNAVTSTVHTFADGIGTARSAVEFFLPPLKLVAGVLADIGHVAGVGGILSFAAGFKAISVAVGAAGAVQARYSTVLAAGEAARGRVVTGIGREAVSYNALSTAIERNSLVLEANAGINAGSAAALEARTLPLAANVAHVYSDLGQNVSTASQQTIAATDGIASAAEKSSESIVKSSVDIAVLGDASTSLAERVGVGVGKTEEMSASLGALSSAQGRYTAALQAGLGPSQAAAIAAGTEAEAYTALASAVAASTAALAANASVNIGSAAAGSESAIANLATREIQLASGARLLVPASAAATGAIAETGAAAAVTAARAEGIGVKLATLGRGTIALAGGYRTLAAIGIGALAFGLYKGFTAATGLERANRRLDDSLNELSLGLSRASTFAHDYSDALSSIKSDKVAVEVAKANLALAQQAVNTSDASKTSAEYQSLVAQLASATDGLRVAQRSLADDEARAAAARRKRLSEQEENERRTQQAITDTIKLRQATGAAHEGDLDERQIALIRTRNDLTIREARVRAGLIAGAGDFAKQLDHEAETNDKLLPGIRARIELLAGLARGLGRIPTERQINLVLNAGSAREGLEAIITELERAHPKAKALEAALREEADSVGIGNPKLAERITLLADFTREVGRTPTKREVEIALKTPKFGDAVNALALVLGQMQGQAQKMGFASGKAFAEQFRQGLLGGPFIPILADLAKRIDAISAKAVGNVTDVSKDQLENAKVNLAAATKTVKDIGTKVAEARDAVSKSVQNLATANRDLADAIKQQSIDVRNAIGQAAQNLSSIGGSLSDSIDQFIDASNRTDAALSGPRAKEAQKLRGLIASGGTGDVGRQAQALANQLEQGQVVEAHAADERKKKSRQQIADLVTEFNRGSITIATFNKRLAGILASDDISYRKAGRVLGIAFAEQFRAQLAGLKEQARAITEGPRIKGITGFEPQIVRPLDTLRESQRQIADAQRRRDEATLEVQKDERRLARVEADRARDALAVHRANRHYLALIEQHTKFLREHQPKPTPPAKGQTDNRPDRTRGARKGGAQVGATLGGGD